MPPVSETRLPASAKEVTKITMKTAQTRNAIGAAVPSWAATTAGRAKIPAPIVELTMLAARLGTPSARINCLSSLGSIGALTGRRLREPASGGKSLVVAGQSCSTLRDARFLSPRVFYLSTLSQRLDRPGLRRKTRGLRELVGR